MGGAFRPTERKAPLVVDSDAVESTKIATKCSQTVTRRRSQVPQIVRGVEHIEFIQCVGVDVPRQTPDTSSRPAMEKIGRRTVTERCYHGFTVSGTPCNIRMDVSSTRACFCLSVNSSLPCYAPELRTQEGCRRTPQRHVRSERLAYVTDW